LPGLGGFSGEARPGSLQITVIDAVQGPTYSPGLLTGALLKQLQTESNTIRPPQLASQVQDEVSFDTGNIHVPRLFGSVDGPSELKRLSQEEFQAKQKRCMASREEAEGATKVASEGTTTVADASGRPIGPLGAEPARLGGRFWDWFCPEVMPNSRPPRDMTTRRQEQDGSGKRAGSRQADGPRSASPTRTSYQARSYSGGGAHRAAASGAPVP
jgi:hypothetical protein